jgi:hypothetical protein
MVTIRLVPSIQQNIVADFLLGASSSTLTSKHKIAMRKIYASLQNHFRSVTISRTQQSPLAGAHGICVGMMEYQLELNVRREREINELTVAIEALEQEIVKQKADIAVLESQLQRPFTAPDHRLLKEITIPPNWTVDREALIRLSDIDRNRSNRESDKQGDKTTVYIWFWISQCQYVTRTS